jgi:hypothetical protein
VHVLATWSRRKTRRLVLDLQVIRPNPTVDWLIQAGILVQQAVDDHDVRKHYDNGADLIDDSGGKKRRLPERALPDLRALAQHCVMRERCRLRRLVVNRQPPGN